MLFFLLLLVGCNAGCVVFLRVPGVDTSALEAEVRGEVVWAIRSSVAMCTILTVLRDGIEIEENLFELQDRRELRWIDPKITIGVVEEPEASAALFRSVVGGQNWDTAFESTRALNPWIKTKRSSQIYVDALAKFDLVPPPPPIECFPLQKKKMIWLHSYGFAPIEPIRGEGLNGWRIVFARVVALAKATNASIVWPCARHSVLVPCGVKGHSWPDEISNSADDDFFPDKERGIDDAMLRWLELESFPEEEEENYEDDASRGVRHLVAHPASSYFDLKAVERYLGAETATPDCLTSDITVKHVRAKGLTRSDLAEDGVVYKLGGGFDLSTMRDSVTPEEFRAVEETGPLRRFSARLERAALKIKERIGGGKIAVVHWRSETLVARKDAKAPKAVQACANAVLDAAQKLKQQNYSVVLVTDIPLDPVKRPLWTSFANKLERAHPKTRSVLQNFLDAAEDNVGVHKIDRIAANYGMIDLGDLAILDQILAVDADIVATHYNSNNDTISSWDGVSFNDCGYAGRFMRTILNRRLAENKTVLNWYPAGGFPKFRSSPSSPSPPQRKVED